MSQQHVAAEPDQLLNAGGTLFLRASELASDLNRLMAARQAGRVLVVLPNWQVYPYRSGYLLVLKMQWNLPATLYLAFDAPWYPRLRELIRADRFFLHADIPDELLQPQTLNGPTRAAASEQIRRRAFLVNGLADGLVELAYQLRQPPWKDEKALDTLRNALPRVRPKASSAPLPSRPHTG